jgi:hypothetical protein
VSSCYAFGGAAHVTAAPVRAPPHDNWCFEELIENIAMLFTLLKKRHDTYLSAWMPRLIDARQFHTYNIESFTDYHFFCVKRTYKYPVSSLASFPYYNRLFLVHGMRIVWRHEFWLEDSRSQELNIRVNLRYWDAITPGTVPNLYSLILLFLKLCSTRACRLSILGPHRPMVALWVVCRANQLFDC